MAITLEPGVAALVGADRSIRELDQNAYIRALEATRPTENDDELITTGQAAKIIGKCPKTVARLVDGGAIPSVRSESGRRMMRKSDIKAWMVREQERTAIILERMRTAADAAGLYDLDDDTTYVDALTSGRVS